MTSAFISGHLPSSVQRAGHPAGSTAGALTPSLASDSSRRCSNNVRRRQRHQGLGLLATSVWAAEQGGAHSRRRCLQAIITHAVPADQAQQEEDLLQDPNRLKWYESKFCADDMPDWNAATFLGSRDIAPGLRAVRLGVEISRERVALRAAYKAPGQRAAVRVQGGMERVLTVCSPPHPQLLNKEPLFLVRGDLFAHDVKTVRDPVSVMGELEVLVREREAPEVWGLEEGDALEVGPAQGSGLDLRGSGLLAIFKYPTVILFVSGTGIGTARALLQSGPDVPSLCCNLRKTVRVYYKAPNSASHAFKEEYDAWAAAATAAPHQNNGSSNNGNDEATKGCDLQVVPTTAATFQQAFDDDDTLMYDPNYTAAVILTGGDAEAEAEARAVCKEAEISAVLSDSQEAAPPQHLDSTPKSFRRWVQDRAN